MFGILECVISLLLITGLSIFFSKFKKKPPIIIAGLCYVLLMASVISAGTITTIPMPVEEVQVNVTSGSIKLYSVVSDGRTYAAFSGTDNQLELKEIFNNDIGQNLERAYVINEDSNIRMPIGDGRCLNFISETEISKVEVTYKNQHETCTIKAAEPETAIVHLSATNGAYDNFIKLLRLALYLFILSLIMLIPFYYVYKNEFKNFEHLFLRFVSNAKGMFKEYRLETIMCVVSTVISYFAILYMDINSLTSWSIDCIDGLLRGGFINRSEIFAQNLWQAYHGTYSGAFFISYFMWGIWNLPLLLVHYLFKIPFQICEPVMFWSKICLELLVLAVAVVCCKIVSRLTGDIKRGLLAFILAAGSVTTFFAVGYSGQDDIFYLLFFLIGLYEILKGNKNIALLFFCMTVYDNPMMIIYTALIIISTSKKFKELIIRLAVNVSAIAASMIFMIGNQGVSEAYQFIRIFNETNIENGFGSVSIFTIIIGLIYFVNFFIKKNENNVDRLMYSLCAISMAFLLLSYSHMHRTQIYMIVIIVCVASVLDKAKMKSCIFGMVLMEYAFMCTTASIHNNYYNILWFTTGIKNLFNIEQVPNISMYNYLLINHSDLPMFVPVFQGITFAAAIWIMYILYPKRKILFDSKLVCPIPQKVLTTVFVSSSLIIIFAMTAIGFKMNHFSVGYSREKTDAITGSQYIEECFKGKSAKWVQLTFRPVTNGQSYPKNQTLQVDIIDNETGEIVGSNSCAASKFENFKNYSLLIKDVKMQSNKWYTFRFSSPNVIEDESNYMYFARTKDNSGNIDRHYALISSNGETVPANYDIIGEIYTG